MAKKPLSRDSKPTQAATQENQQQPTGQTGHTVWFYGAPFDVSPGGPLEIYEGGSGRKVAQAETIELAELIAGLPAMQLALLAISWGVARIERSKYDSELVEFCFGGIRQSIGNDLSGLASAVVHAGTDRIADAMLAARKAVRQ